MYYLYLCLRSIHKSNHLSMSNIWDTYCCTSIREETHFCFAYFDGNNI